MKHNFELAFTNLGTGNFILKTVSNFKEYLEGYSLINPTGDNDVEVQFLEGDLTGEAIDHIDWILKKLEEGHNLEDIEAVINVYGNLEDAEKQLKDGAYTLIEANSKYDAFEFYLRDSGELDSIPSHMVDYLDFERMYQDWVCTSLIVEKVKDGTYLVGYVD